ncbi:hypothetical protein [Metallibacterium sp.]|uniref:hypothetical protein n=1 Tax=Metallibacterium sp. TaxID=2940281 RepID=UPI00262C1085|nr:hypothetical protein [Metallibacterium sp.]
MNAKKTSRKEKPEITPTAFTTKPEDIANSITRLIPNASDIYADSLVHVGIGPYISKLSLGTQDPSTGLIKSITTISMPTNAIADLAKYVSNAIKAASAENKFSSAYSMFLEAPVTTSDQRG